MWEDLRVSPLIFCLVESCFGLFLGGVALQFASISHSSLQMVDLWFKYMGFTTFCLNMLPPFLIFWILIFLTRKPSVAYIIQVVMTLVLCLVNYYKIMLRNEPFVFSDFGLIFEAKNMIGEYSLMPTLPVFFLVLVLVVSVVAHAFVMPFSVEFPFELRFSLIAAALSGLLFLCVLKFGISSQSVYEKTEDYNKINRMSFSQVYLSRGLWYPFLYSASASAEPDFQFEITGDGSGTPPGYLILEEFEPAPNSGIPLGDISVVSVMLEGFCDYSQFPALAREAGVLEAYEIWHRLEEESVSGNIINTVFGGGTAYTERSYLVGVPGADDAFTQATDSYVWMFREAGYFTHGAHIGYQDFYNRFAVNKNLGFQEYFYFEDTYASVVPTERLYDDSDTAFFDSIIQQMERTLVLNKPTFGFYVTIQNHGPYEAAKDMSNPYISNQLGMNQNTRAVLQTYLNGIVDTLEQIARLEDYLNSREDPVMMVLFGDHMPWAGNSDEVLIDLRGNLDTSTQEGMLNYYGTPFVIWANDAARQVITGEYPSDVGVISNHFLMNILFRTVGWQETAEIAFSSYIMDRLPVIFRSWEHAYWYHDDVIVKLPAEEQKWASLFAAYAYERRTRLYNSP